MDYLKQFKYFLNEGKMTIENGDQAIWLKVLEENFDITLQELQDIFQNILDGDVDVRTWQSFEAKVKIELPVKPNEWKSLPNKDPYFIVTIDKEHEPRLFKRKLVTDKMDDISSHLETYGLKIFYISNKEDKDDAIGITIWISKSYDNIFKNLKN